MGNDPPPDGRPLNDHPAVRRLQDVDPHLEVVDLISDQLGGSVLLVRHDGEYEVVKCLPSRSASQRTRAQREAHMLMLAQGPHVVRCMGVIDADDYVYLRMELLPLPSLRKRFRDDWSAADLVTTGLAAALALQRVHQHGAVVNDFKPRNLGVRAVGDGPELVVKMFDFGHANTVAGTRTTRFVAGSVDYVAPEVYRAGTPSPASDVWSWGRTWHLLASGQFFQKFRSFNQLLAHGRRELPPVAQVSRVPLPDAFARIIDTAMADDPAKRPFDGDQLTTALLDVVGREWGADLDQCTQWRLETV